MSRPTSPLTATKLRIILVASLFLIILLAAGLFYVGYKQLNGIATTVSRSVADANASKNTLSSLQQTERDLAANRDVVERANKIVADSNKFNYQNTVIVDLQTYASRAGLTINNIDFSGNDTATSGMTAGSATSPTATPGATPGATAGNYNTNKVTITLANPVNYDNFLHFLRSIELNLTKFQISSVSLNKASENPKAVTTSSLTIELYTK